MSKKIVIWSELNQMGFCIIVDDADYPKAKELAQKGFDMWNDPENYPKYNDVGYAEPAEELLKEAGIKYEIEEKKRQDSMDEIIMD